MSSEKLATLFLDSSKIIELRRQVQPYSAKEDLWSWNVLRRISIYFTLIFQKLSISPNTVSWLSVLFVLLSGLFMMMATPLSFVLAFISYNLGYLFDCVDGELARLTKNTSNQGFFIDMLIRAATLPVFLSIVLSLLVINHNILLSTSSIIALYLVIVAVIMSLLIPLSYDLTHASFTEQKDPVQQIRNKSILFEFTGFILGLPGFFCTLIITIFLNPLLNFDIVSFYILMFILVLVLKVLIRLIVTISTFNKSN